MDILVPDLGDFSDVEVIEVLVKPGDRVEVEDALLTLETEKATMDVPAPAAGTIKSLAVEAGSTVSAGDLIGVLESDAPSEPAAAPSAAESDEAAGSTGTDDRPEDDKTVRQPRPAKPVAVTVPDLGDFSDVDVIEVMVAVGDDVERDQGLITLETEKATMDVPAPAAGTIVELTVGAGDKINAGDQIALLRPASAGPSAAEGEETKPSSGEAPEPVAAPAPDDVPRPGSQAKPRPIGEAGFARAHASPSVRRLARELGVDLGNVEGSGRKGRVTSADVKAFVKRIMQGGAATGPSLPKVPEVDFARFGDVEVNPLSRIQKISGPRLHASWVNVPHVTQHDDADITELEQTRQKLKATAEKRGIKLTPLAFIMRACALVLDEFPAFRSSLSADGENLVLKKYIHIGFAADTPNGLVVPVIRDADKKDVYELAASLAELSSQARDGKLKGTGMQGGVFTISSLGGIGGNYFTPIINAPEVAILGVSRNYWKPYYSGKAFEPRLALPLSLSYDHRVIDGAQAARFIVRLGEILTEVDRLVEAIP